MLPTGSRLRLWSQSPVNSCDFRRADRWRRVELRDHAELHGLLLVKAGTPKRWTCESCHAIVTNLFRE
jgi:hypothetical protein